MSLWFLSYVHVETNRFAGVVICEGGDHNTNDGLTAAAATAYDLGIAPGKDGPANEQYQVSGKLVPPHLVEVFAAHRDRLLSLDQVREAFPQFDWKRLADHAGLN